MSPSTSNPNHVVALTEAELGRARRVRELARLGDEGVEPLVEQLTDPSWAVRREAVSALAQLGDTAAGALRRVIETCRDDETRIAAAVDALAGSAGRVEPLLAEMARHEDPAVAADAAQIIGRRRATTEVDTLIALIDHPDDNVVIAALEALGRVGGKRAVESLIAAVRSERFFRTFPAIDVLGRTGDPRAVAPLVELLRTSQYVLEAARALGHTGDPAAVAPLCALLGRGGELLVRVSAVSLAELNRRVVERFGDTGAVEESLRQHAPAVAARHISRALSDASPSEIEDLCWVLGALGSQDAVPTLVALLDEAPQVAASAGLALERIGQFAAEQVMLALRTGTSEKRRSLLPVVVARLRNIEGIVACLGDPDPAVRASACDALVRTGNPAVVRHLFGLLGDDDPRVVQSATAAIQSMGSAATERLALAAARSGDPRVERAAFRILAYFGFDSALRLFLAAIEDGDPRLQETAIQGLPFLSEPEALDALLAASRHTEARVRAAAMRALGNSAGELRAKSYLLRGLTDEDAWVRYFAAQGLGKLGFSAAAEPIATLLSDPAGQVRVAAVEALSHLEGEVPYRVLAEAAESDDADVKRAALLGLGIKRRPDSLPIITRAALSEDAATRLVALSGMAGFPDDRVLDAFERAAADADASVRTAAVGFLGARLSRAATQRLVHLAQEPEIAGEVRDALAKFSAGRVAGVRGALARADEDLAALLASSLVRMRHPEATRALLDALEADPPPARKAVAAALTALPGREAVDALRRRAEHDPDPEVRHVASSALAR